MKLVVKSKICEAVRATMVVWSRSCGCGISPIMTRLGTSRPTPRKKTASMAMLMMPACTGRVATGAQPRPPMVEKTAVRRARATILYFRRGYIYTEHGRAHTVLYQSLSPKKNRFSWTESLTHHPVDDIHRHEGVHQRGDAPNHGCEKRVYAADLTETVFC